jgi:hypothetical protein
MTDQPVSAPAVRPESDYTDEVRRLYAYDPETGIVSWKASCHKDKNGKEAGHNGVRGYRRVVVSLDGKKRALAAHRVAWLLMTGAWPEGMIDHINRVTSDNRWCNLRQATNSKQNGNKRLHGSNTSGHRGVRWKGGDTNAWVATILEDGLLRHLGTYHNKEEAIRAYEAEAKEVFGEFYLPPEQRGDRV